MYNNNTHFFLGVLLAIDFTDAHSNLVNTDKEYRAAVEASSIDRQEELNEAFNKLIDDSLVETDRNFELHVMSLEFAGLNPYTTKESFFEEEKDFAVAVLCDNGMIILGRLANITFNWDEILYSLVYENGSVLLHLNDNTDVFVGDDNFTAIFTALQDTLTEDNAIPRFIEG